MKKRRAIHWHRCRYCAIDVICNCLDRPSGSEVTCLSCEDAGKQLYEEFKRGLNEAKGGST